MNARTLSQEEWAQRAASLELPTNAMIGGKAVSSLSGDTFECLNPATEEIIANVASCDVADVDKAVNAARQTFVAGSWRHMAPVDRKGVLLRLAGLIRDNAAELALMDTLSVGKPITDAYTSDVPGAADFIAWFAESIDKLYDEVAPTDRSSLAMVTREPVGVVGTIVPWNYPIEETSVKLAPALAAGNSVILKPAEQSPFSALRLGELALEAGLPPGVLNVVPGLGPTAGQAIGRHPDIDCVSFTGSSDVGKLLLKYSADSNMKPVWLECGGKSPNIVFADCGNIKHAAAEAVRSVFRNQGEVCSAGSRLIVDRRIKDNLLDLLVADACRIMPGDPLDPATKMGAMVSSDHFRRVMDYIETGKREGASLDLGGVELQINGTGHYIAPTIFSAVKNEMTIAQDEIFGPVLAVMEFATEEEAIDIANQSIYGLVASVWTESLDRAHRVARALQAGSVTVNGVDAQSEAVPFGGYKQSGIGREHSLHAYYQYTQLKTTWIRFTSS